MKTNPSALAAQVTRLANQRTFPTSTGEYQALEGLSFREHLISLALQGIAARGSYRSPDEAAASALGLADAVLVRMAAEQVAGEPG
jgi:hypothetical protein